MKNEIFYIDFKTLEIKMAYTEDDITKMSKKADVRICGCNMKKKRNDIFTDLDKAKEGLKLYILKKEFKNDKFKKKNNVCYYCGMPLGYKAATVDHKDPVSKYPNRKLDKTNFVLSCENCNQEKDNKDFQEVNITRNINIKSQFLKQNKSRTKTEKIGRVISRDLDNALELARKDSNIWDVNIFFSGSQMVKSNML